MTKAPSCAAVSAKVVSGFASGSRMAARNMARPAIAACQLFHKRRGRITSEAPVRASRTRKASQLRGSRRIFRSLGTSRTSAKRAPRAKLRSRAAIVSCGEAMGVEVVLITLCSGALKCFSTARGKNKTNSRLISREWTARLGIFKIVDFAHAGEGAAHVWDSDGAADDEGDIEGVDDLFALPAFFAAAHEMVGDAIVAAENGGSDQAQKFLGLVPEGSRPLALFFLAHKTLDAEVAAAEDFFVEVGAKFLEVVETVGHGSSEMRLCHSTEGTEGTE